jgi:hypothetical protein
MDTKRLSGIACLNCAIAMDESDISFGSRSAIIEE